MHVPLVVVESMAIYVLNAATIELAGDFLKRALAQIQTEVASKSNRWHKKAQLEHNEKAHTNLAAKIGVLERKLLVDVIASSVLAGDARASIQRSTGAALRAPTRPQALQPPYPAFSSASRRSALFNLYRLFTDNRDFKIQSQASIKRKNYKCVCLQSRVPIFSCVAFGSGRRRESGWLGGGDMRETEIK